MLAESCAEGAQDFCLDRLAFLFLYFGEIIIFTFTFLHFILESSG